MQALLAQIRNPVLPEGIGGGMPPSVGQGTQAIGNFISAIVGGMIVVGFIIALFYLLTGGFMWITSGGDKTNLENARNKITHAIIGFLVLASVWAIMTLVARFVGWDIEKLPFPTIETNGSSNSSNVVGGNKLK